MNHSKKALTSVLVLLTAALIVTGCAKKPDAMSQYKAVASGEAEFYSVDAGASFKIDQLTQAAGVEGGAATKATKFAVVDLDADGTPEVILALSVNGDDNYGFEILHWQDEKVYGYAVTYRSFSELKADGTFSFSSGAADSGFASISFTDSACSIDKITYSETVYNDAGEVGISYYADKNASTKEAFDAALDVQNEKENAEWYDFTQEKIDELLSK